jgi:hypothetical protein
MKTHTSYLFQKIFKSSIKYSQDSSNFSQKILKLSSITHQFFTICHFPPIFPHPHILHFPLPTHPSKLQTVSNWEHFKITTKREKEKQGKAQSYLMSNKRIFTINKDCSCRPKNMRMETTQTEAQQKEVKPFNMTSREIKIAEDSQLENCCFDFLFLNDFLPAFYVKMRGRKPSEAKSLLIGSFKCN